MSRVVKDGLLSKKYFGVFKYDLIKKGEFKGESKEEEEIQRIISVKVVNTYKFVTPPLFGHFVSRELLSFISFKLTTVTETLKYTDVAKPHDLVENYHL